MQEQLSAIGLVATPHEDARETFSREMARALAPLQKRVVVLAQQNVRSYSVESVLFIYD
jgi:hypothetical protein